MPKLRRAVMFAALASVVPGVILQSLLILDLTDRLTDPPFSSMSVLWNYREEFFGPHGALGYTWSWGVLAMTLGLNLLGWMLLSGYLKNPARRTLGENRRFWSVSLIFHGALGGFYLVPYFELPFINYSPDTAETIILGASLALLSFSICMLLGSGCLAFAYRDFLLKEAEMRQLAAMLAEDQREAAALASTLDHEPTRRTIPQ